MSILRHTSPSLRAFRSACVDFVPVQSASSSSRVLSSYSAGTAPFARLIDARTLAARVLALYCQVQNGSVARRNARCALRYAHCTTIAGDAASPVAMVGCRERACSTGLPCAGVHRRILFARAVCLRPLETRARGSEGADGRGERSSD